MYVSFSPTIHYIQVKMNLVVAVTKQQSCMRFETGNMCWQISAPGDLTPKKQSFVKEVFGWSGTALSLNFPTISKSIALKPESQQKAEQGQAEAWRAMATQHNTATMARFQSISNNTRIFYRNSTYTITYIIQAYRCTFENMLHCCISTTLNIMFRLASTNTEENYIDTKWLL